MAGKFWPAAAAKAVPVSQSLMSEPHTLSSDLFLKKKQDYDRVKREGKRCQTSLFNVMFCSSPTYDTRVGIIVGRRFGKAVVRNRGKRIFRELVRKTHSLLVKGYDIIVFPKRPILTYNHRALCNSWVQVLAQEGLLSSTDPIPCGK
jgi:ribonuclease P protein component